MNSFFLTGGTGVIGSALVPYLLKDPETEVHLLIRANSQTESSERLEKLLQFWGWQEETEQRDRIKAWHGDVSESHFGLSEKQYKTLSGRCTHIIHCAGAVRMNLPLESARRSAVDGARQILSFARQLAKIGQLAKVEFVSTVGVGGKHPGHLSENWVEGPVIYHNTYEQAKAEAETLVRLAIETEKLPITIHRPSMVIGDSHTGRVMHFQIFYFICEFLSGRLTFGLHPHFSDAQLDIMPCDTAAHAIARASLDPTTAGNIFHLASGPQHSPRLGELRDIVRERFVVHGLGVPRVYTLPLKLYSTLTQAASLLMPPQRRKMLSPLPIYLDYLADQQRFENTAFKTWWSSKGQSIPDYRDYLPQVLDTYIEARYGHTTQSEERDRPT